MNNTWDQMAQVRHQLLIEGKDVTFSRVFVPKIMEIVRSFERIETYKVLDFGCGTGVLTKILANEVRDIVGIDSSMASISIASNHANGTPNIEFFSTSFEAYTRELSEEFDFVIAHMTLQVIEELGLALSGISRAIKSNGKFLFSIPHPCFWALIKHEIGEDHYQYHQKSQHGNKFTFDSGLEYSVPYYHRSLDNYSSELKDKGFTIIDLIEPFPSEDVMKFYSRPWFYPGFLFILCKKVHLEDIDGH